VAGFLDELEEEEEEAAMAEEVDVRSRVEAAVAVAVALKMTNFPGPTRFLLLPSPGYHSMHSTVFASHVQSSLREEHSPCRISRVLYYHDPLLSLALFQCFPCALACSEFEGPGLCRAFCDKRDI
jgi:hypothetical protein